MVFQRTVEVGQIFVKPLKMRYNVFQCFTLKAIDYFINRNLPLKRVSSGSEDYPRENEKQKATSLTWVYERWKKPFLFPWPKSHTTYLYCSSHAVWHSCMLWLDCLWGRQRRIHERFVCAPELFFFFLRWLVYSQKMVTVLSKALFVYLFCF